MRIGLVARCDSTGLGIQSKEFFDHIPCKAFVIDFSSMSPTQSFNEILKPHPEWYPGQKFFKWGNVHNSFGDVPLDLIYEFIQDIDILFFMETPYDFNFFKACNHKRVKTVLQFNYELLDYPSGFPSPSLFAAPSMWNYDLVPDPKIYLPVPVAAERFKPEPVRNTFIHIAGRPAMQDRNGTHTFLNALRFVKNEITVIVKSQNGIRVPYTNKNIDLQVACGNVNNYVDNYSGGVLVLPRKYGGLCLPINEAIAAGMPVITTDISPNNLWLPKEWLVPSEHRGMIRSKKNFDYYEADPVKLAEKIDQFCDPQFYDEQYNRALEIRETISWDALRGLYDEKFEQLMK